MRLTHPSTQPRAAGIPPSRGHAASPAPSKPPMQTHTLPRLKRPRRGSMLPTVGGTYAKGGGEGGRRAGEEEKESNNKRTTITSVSPPSKTEQISATLEPRTNLIVFFINTRVISLQDKSLLGFFTFFIF